MPLRACLALGLLLLAAVPSLAQSDCSFNSYDFRSHAANKAGKQR